MVNRIGFMCATREDNIAAREKGARAPQFPSQPPRLSARYHLIRGEIVNNLRARVLSACTNKARTAEARSWYKFLFKCSKQNCYN